MDNAAFFREVAIAESIGLRTYSEIIYFRSLMRSGRIWPWDAQKALTNYFGLSEQAAREIAAQHCGDWVRLLGACNR